MTDMDQPVVSAPIVEDPAQPSLAELQQREVFEVPVVAVRLDGPAAVHTLPNKKCSVSIEPLATSPTRVLTADSTRARAVILLRSTTVADYFILMSSSSGQGVPWPANVPLILTTCDEMFAKFESPTTSATLSVILENWAD